MVITCRDDAEFVAAMDRLLEHTCPCFSDDRTTELVIGFTRGTLTILIPTSCLRRMPIARSRFRDDLWKTRASRCLIARLITVDGRHPLSDEASCLACLSESVLES